MKKFCNAILGAFGLVLSSNISLFAIEDLKISVVSSNVVLSWPSAETESYIVQYRQSLKDTNGWQTLATSWPADSGTNLTCFIHTNAVQNPVGGGSYMTMASGSMSSLSSATATLLPLLPLAAGDLIDIDDIVIDAKSGVSGAGRAAKEGSLFTEVAEGVHAYGVASHRHAPEIEEQVSAAAGRTVVLNFTPHLMPMNRGILASIYVRLKGGATPDDLRAALAERYDGEPFVRVLDAGQVPATRHVRGSNYNLIGVFADRLPRRAILLSVIDNLVKGASGQAVQNMNLMFGLPETMGLEAAPLFP